MMFILKDFPDSSERAMEYQLTSCEEKFSRILRKREKKFEQIIDNVKFYKESARYMIHEVFKIVFSQWK